MLRNKAALTRPQPQVPECHRVRSFRCMAAHVQGRVCHGAHSGSFPSWSCALSVIQAGLSTCLSCPPPHTLPCSPRLHSHARPPLQALDPKSAICHQSPLDTCCCVCTEDIAHLVCSSSTVPPRKRGHHTHALMDMAGQTRALLQQSLPAGLRVGVRQEHQTEPHRTNC